MQGLVDPECSAQALVEALQRGTPATRHQPLLAAQLDDPSRDANLVRHTDAPLGRPGFKECPATGSRQVALLELMLSVTGAAQLLVDRRHRRAISRC